MNEYVALRTAASAPTVVTYIAENVIIYGITRVATCGLRGCHVYPLK
jgi:hypothetical protein